MNHDAKVKWVPPVVGLRAPEKIILTQSVFEMLVHPEEISTWYGWSISCEGHTFERISVVTSFDQMEREAMTSLATGFQPVIVYPALGPNAMSQWRELTLKAGGAGGSVQILSWTGDEEARALVCGPSADFLSALKLPGEVIEAGYRMPEDSQLFSALRGETERFLTSRPNLRDAYQPRWDYWEVYLASKNPRAIGRVASAARNAPQEVAGAFDRFLQAVRDVLFPEQTAFAYLDAGDEDLTLMKLLWLDQSEKHIEIGLKVDESTFSAFEDIRIEGAGWDIRGRLSSAGGQADSIIIVSVDTPDGDDKAVLSLTNWIDGVGEEQDPHIILPDDRKLGIVR